MDPENALSILFDHFENGTMHPHYDHMVATAEWSKAMTAGGAGYGKIVRNIRDKETDHQKDFRERVSYPETPEVLEGIQTTCERIHGVDGIVRVIEHNDGNKLKEIEACLNHFDGRGDVSDYLERVQLYYEFRDANAWGVVERRDKRDANGEVVELHTYPLVVLSHQAINYEYVNNVPEWLLVRQGEVSAYVYYLYAVGITLMARMLDEGEGVAESELSYTDQGGKQYAYSVYLNDTKSFPGEKFGACHDVSVDDMTVRAPVYYPTKGTLNRIVRNASLLAVDVMLHCYKKTFAYDYPCEFKGAYNRGCGNVEGKDPKCPKCNGTGSSLHHSEMDLTRVSIPELGDGDEGSDANKVMKLADLIHTVAPNIESTKFTYELVESDKARVSSSLFNSVEAEKPVVSTTATAIHIDRQNANRRIAPLAARKELLNTIFHHATAEHLGFDDGFTYRYEYPKDFTIETLDEMLVRLRDAKTNGAPISVINSLEADIVKKQYAGDVIKAKNHEALYRFYPMSHLSEQSQISTLLLRDPMDYQRLLFENWSEVTRIIETNHRDFFASKSQSATLRSIVDGIKQDITLAPVASLDLSLIGPEFETEVVAEEDTGGGE